MQALVISNIFVKRAPHAFLMIELINSASSEFVTLPKVQGGALPDNDAASLAFAGAYPLYLNAVRI